jgi:uncharacterized membrane protein YagU involved in acid resistance
MATMQTRQQTDMGWWARRGAIGGIIAGLVFAMFEMIMAALLNGANAFSMPLRMIGATVLGREALQPSYSLLTAGFVGLIVHMMLSIVFGIVFALLVSALPMLANSPPLLLVAASVSGLLLWLVNFYAIAPALGWNWFPTRTNPLVQFLAHTVMYGMVLGFYLDRVRR